MKWTLRERERERKKKLGEIVIHIAIEVLQLAVYVWIDTNSMVYELSIIL